jgi:hypothetical protein
MANTYHLNMRVADYQGQPLVGAVVHLKLEAVEDRLFQTGEGGCLHHYSTINTRPRDYTITVCKAGYEPCTFKGVVEWDQEGAEWVGAVCRYTVHLTPTPEEVGKLQRKPADPPTGSTYHLYLYVQKQEAQQPIQGAVIHLQLHNDGPPVENRLLETGPDGVCDWATTINTQPAKFVVSVNKEGRTPLKFSGDVDWIETEGNWTGTVIWNTLLMRLAPAP